MSKKICPGQDTRFWQPGDIFEVTCGECGASVEFFKDDARRRCPKCGARVKNPKLSLGCALWCEHAKECLGFDPKEMQEEDSDQVSLADELVARMKKHFGDDQKRISHALAVLDEAQRLLKDERADPQVVISAAILHDIGIHEAEARHGSNAGKYQEIEGPPIARKIMEELDLDEETVEHVSKIIANHHSAKDIDTPEFRIIWDADHIVNFLEEATEKPDDERIEHLAEKVLKTNAGSKRVREIFKKAQTA